MLMTCLSAIGVACFVHQQPFNFAMQYYGNQMSWIKALMGNTVCHMARYEECCVL